MPSGVQVFYFCDTLKSSLWSQLMNESDYKWNPIRFSFILFSKFTIIRDQCCRPSIRLEFSSFLSTITKILRNLRSSKYSHEDKKLVHFFHIWKLSLQFSTLHWSLRFERVACLKICKISRQIEQMARDNASEMRRLHQIDDLLF